MKILLVRIDPLINSNFHSGNSACHSIAAYFLSQKPGIKESSVNIIEFDSLENETPNIRVARILENTPDIVGFSCYCWNIDCVLKYSIYLKKLAPKTTIILGGPQVSFSSGEIMKQNPQIDFIVRGEGEVTFNELARTLLKSNRHIISVLGITYRLNGKVVANPDRPLIEDLDKIPSPLLSGIVDLARTNGEVTVETVRGCLYHCNYCLYHKNTANVRSYSLSRIESEIKSLCNSKYVNLISFADPTFNFNEKRALKILSIVEEYNKDVGLSLELRAELLTSALIEKISRLNIVELAFGLQTINKKTNRNLSRSFNRVRFERNIRALKNKLQGKSTKVDIDLIYGLPGDDIDDYKDSVDFVVSLGARVYYQPLRVFEGSQIRQMANTYSILYDPSPPNNVFSTSTFPRKHILEAYKVNAGLDYYQDFPNVRIVLDKLRTLLNLTPAGICQLAGDFFWHEDLLRNFRVCNFTPDDRKWELCHDDLLSFVQHLVLNEAALCYSKGDILEETERLKDERVQADSCNSKYFRLAI